MGALMAMIMLGAPIMLTIGCVSDFKGEEPYEDVYSEFFD